MLSCYTGYHRRVMIYACILLLMIFSMTVLPLVRLLKYKCAYEWIVGELGLYIAEIKLQGSYTIISRSSSDKCSVCV